MRKIQSKLTFISSALLIFASSATKLHSQTFTILEDAISIPETNSLTFPEKCLPNQDGWRIGKIPLQTDPNDRQTLEITSQGKVSLDSHNFVAKVGGVNFEERAIPDETINNKAIGLAYDENAVDGERLIIKIGDTNLRPEISDWLLIPIAKFADSDFTGVVSLFGEGSDRDKNYYIKFHPAFKNTLVGYRLLQADILLMNLSDNTSLPALNCQLLLGDRESEPENENLTDEFVAISNILKKHQFTSWVLTDIDQPTLFSVDGDNLELETTPYYYFWLQNEASVAQHQTTVDTYNSQLSQHKVLVEQFKSLQDIFNVEVEKYNQNNSSVELSWLKSTEQELNIKQSQLEAIEAKLNTYQADLSTLDLAMVDPVTELTTELQNQIELVRAFNPAVFEAVELTSAYAALFRYLKTNHNNSWQGFIESISQIPIKPSVTTPSIMPKLSRNN